MKKRRSGVTSLFRSVAISAGKRRAKISRAATAARKRRGRKMTAKKRSMNPVGKNYQKCFAHGIAVGRSIERKTHGAKKSAGKPLKVRAMAKMRKGQPKRNLRAVLNYLNRRDAALKRAGTVRRRRR